MKLAVQRRELVVQGFGRLVLEPAQELLGDRGKLGVLARQAVVGRRGPDQALAQLAQPAFQAAQEAAVLVVGFGDRPFEVARPGLQFRKIRHGRNARGLDCHRTWGSLHSTHEIVAVLCRFGFAIIVAEQV